MSIMMIKHVCHLQILDPENKGQTRLNSLNVMTCNDKTVTQFYFAGVEFSDIASSMSKLWAVKLLCTITVHL